MCSLLCTVLILAVLSWMPAVTAVADSYWKNSFALGQADEWYGSEEAKRVAENVLLYQKNSGGWPKNVEMHEVLTDAQKQELEAQKDEHSCFDNGATTTEMQFLARVYKNTPDERYRKAFNRALDCILEAQSLCGDGWPQYWPKRGGTLMKYSDFITFNDGLMVHILEVLANVMNAKGDFADIVDDDARQQARESYDRGLQCVLDCQIRDDDGNLTVWCAQHYPGTYLPAVGRRFELPSYSGAESAEVAMFLMKIDNPTTEIYQAVEGAVHWFETHIVENVTLQDFTNKYGEKDRRMVEAQGKRLWGRFVQIGGRTGQESHEALLEFLEENGDTHGYGTADGWAYRSDRENASESYDPSRADQPVFGIKQGCNFRYVYSYNDTDSIIDSRGIATPTSLNAYDRTTYAFMGTWGEKVLTAYQSWKKKHPTDPGATADEPEDVKRYSQWMVASEMQRTPHPYNLDGSPNKTRWAYSLGLELESIFDTYLAYKDEAVANYVKEYPAKMINDDGSIERYSLGDYNLDNVRTGHFLLRYYNLWPAEKERTALETLMTQLEQQPRTEDGVWWHKEIYKQQVWLDGIFMGLPYYVLAAPQLRPDKATDYYADAVDQIVKTEQRTFDETTGLWKHAWDETHQMFWADPTTGQSQHTWARALGWFSMAMLEVLETLPNDYERRAELLPLFQKVMAAVLRYQDKESGVWFDVLDVSDPRNYLEATASAMFTYCMLKGTRLGLLDESFGTEGIKAYRNVVKQFVAEEADGTLSLTQCCQVSGLGPDSNRRRDGSFDYYMSEPVVKNDAKGIGPFIWASLEMERLGYHVGNLFEGTVDPEDPTDPDNPDPDDPDEPDDPETPDSPLPVTENIYLVTEGETFKSGAVVSCPDITLTIGENGGPDFLPALPLELGAFTAYSPGNNVNGNRPGGTFYVFSPTAEGQLTIGVKQNPVKPLFIEEDGVAMTDFNGLVLDDSQPTAYMLTAAVKAGSTYKLYCTGSKLGFFGFYFVKPGDATTVKAKDVGPLSAGTVFLLTGRRSDRGAKGIQIAGGRKIVRK